MLTTKEQWRNLALGLVAVYIGFVVYLAFSGDLISRDECAAMMWSTTTNTIIVKTPPPE